MTSRTALTAFCLLTLSVAACVGDDDAGGDSGSGGSNGGNGGSAGGGSGGGGSGGGLSCSSGDHCGSGGFVCGVHTVASCGEVDCGACRFHREQLGPSDITAAPDRSIHLAYFDQDLNALVHAVVGVSGLETDVIASDARGSEVAIAVANDGSVHVVFLDDSGQVTHASRAGGSDTWETASADTNGEGIDVAADVDNAVHILVTGEDPVTRARQVRHVTQSGGAYTSVALDGVMVIGNAVVARGDDGAIALAVRSELMKLAVFELVDGAFVQDTSLPDMSDQPAEWSIAVGAGGTLRVLALLGNYTLRTGSQLVLATRQGGVWNVGPVEGVAAVVTDGIASATGPMDTSHIAYFARNEDGLFYTRPGSTRRLNLLPSCDGGEVKLAIDAQDQPHLLYACDSDGPQYVAPIARYSDAYLAACDDGANLICDRACECGAPDCCYNDGSADGSNGCSFGPGGAGRDICVANFQVRLCGDLTVDEAPLVDSCKPTLDDTAPMCLDNGYTIPAECWPVIHSNN